MDRRYVRWRSHVSVEGYEHKERQRAGEEVDHVQIGLANQLLLSLCSLRLRHLSTLPLPRPVLVISTCTCICQQSDQQSPFLTATTKHRIPSKSTESLFDE